MTERDSAIRLERLAYQIKDAASKIEVSVRAHRDDYIVEVRVYSPHYLLNMAGIEGWFDQANHTLSDVTDALSGTFEWHPATVPPVLDIPRYRVMTSVLVVQHHRNTLELTYDSLRKTLHASVGRYL